MSEPRLARDSALLDAIEALPAAQFAGRVWRVVREGRDPLQCSAVGGRWDDRTFEVLYTSKAADGAMSEMYFHLSRGQPVMPSLVRYKLFEIKFKMVSCLQFSKLDDLEALGMATASFGQLSYMEREQEYPRSQQIAEIAYFLGRDGIIVPSARSTHQNMVVFCERVDVGAFEVIKDHGTIRWDEWRRKPFGY